MSNSEFDRGAPLRAWEQFFVPVAEASESNIFGVLRRRWATALCFALLIIGLGSFVLSSARKTYAAKGFIVVPPGAPRSSSEQSIGDSLVGSLQSISGAQDAATQAVVLGSNDLLSQAYSLKVADGGLTREEKLKGFGSPDISNVTKQPLAPAWAVDVKLERDTDVVDITTSAYDPVIAAKFGKLILRTYLKNDLRQSSAEARKGLSFVEKKIADLQLQLRDASGELANYQEAGQVIAPTSEETEATNQLYALRALVENTRAEAEADEQAERQAAEELHQTSPQILQQETVAENPAYSEARTALAAVQQQLIAVESEYRPGTAARARLQRQYDQSAARLRSLSKTLITSKINAENPTLEFLQQKYATALTDATVARGKFEVLSASLQQHQKEFLTLPSREKNYFYYKRKVDAITAALATLSSKYYELLVLADAPVAHATIGETPTPPRSPSSSNRNSFVVLVLAGLAFGITLAALLDLADHSVKNIRAFRGVCELPVLTGMPQVKKSEAILSDRPRANQTLEAIRVLRSNLYSAGLSNAKKVVAVTSPQESDGRSSVALNLAIALGLDGKRVLLADFDLRAPTIHLLAGLKQEPGSSTYVLQNETFENVIQKSRYENVDVLTSGPLPPLTTEFLELEGVRRLILKARDNYDFVVIDTSYVNGVADFQVISQFIDAGILVVAAERTLTKRLSGAMSSLRQVRAPMIGAVLNRLKKGNASDFGF
jgi:succinoglycan biosynthesis transport protein ExoP